MFLRRRWRQHAASVLGYVPPDADKWEISSTRVVLQEELGQGAFGVVNKGQLTGLGRIYLHICSIIVVDILTC